MAVVKITHRMQLNFQVRMTDESASRSSLPVGSLASETYDELVADVAACATLESLVCGKGVPKPTKQRARRSVGASVRPPAKVAPFNAYERVAQVVKACREERKRAVPEPNDDDIEDTELSKMARFTDGLALQDYAPFLHYVPRLVNIVRLPAFKAHPLPSESTRVRVGRSAPWD